jgi:DNA-binding XRE family transcriptional regulator
VLVGRRRRTTDNETLPHRMQEEASMAKSETLGQRLRRLRQAADFTQERLAAQTGLAVSSIRNWEQDHRTPNIFALFKIARALGRRIEDFVEGLE